MQTSSKTAMQLTTYIGGNRPIECIHYEKTETSLAAEIMVTHPTVERTNIIDSLLSLASWRSMFASTF